MKNVTLYTWPDSQCCLDCSHSVGLIDNQDGSDQIENIEMASLCLINCQSNDGVNCKKRKISKPMENEE